MRATRTWGWMLLAGAAIGGAGGSWEARAAESYDSCVGFITSLPATVATQGTWCLRGDLSTAIGTGAAILVNTNNVTIDCNHFKLGGLAAGLSTLAVGIRSSNRANVTIRNCTLRGFNYGVQLLGQGGGHLVEGNRLDGTTYIGVQVEGDGAIVRGNQIIDTGGGVGGGWAMGVVALGSSEVVDNMIWGIAPAGTRNDTYGMAVGNNTNGRVAGNRISGLTGTHQVGIRAYAPSSRVRIVDNSIESNGWHLYCDTASGGAIRDNVVSGGSSLGTNCVDLGGNVNIP